MWFPLLYIRIWLYYEYEALVQGLKKSFGLKVEKNKSFWGFQDHGNAN